MSKNTRTYLVYITVAVLIVGLCVAIWVFKFNILFLAVFFLSVGILLFLSIVLLLIKTKRGKIRELEKGKKLAETVEKPWKSRQIMAGAIVYTCSVAVAIIFGVIEVIQGNTKFSIIPIIATLPAVITAFSPKKCYIYENGIQCRVWFIKWDEIKDFEWKNGVLRIKAKGVRRELLLEDKNGEIRKIVEKMVKKMKKTSIIEVIKHVLAIMLILNFILPLITFVVNQKGGIKASCWLLTNGIIGLILAYSLLRELRYSFLAIFLFFVVNFVNVMIIPLQGLDYPPFYSLGVVPFLLGVVLGVRK